MDIDPNLLEILNQLLGNKKTIPAKPKQNPVDASIPELYELAAKSFKKENWEAAESLYLKLISKGEPFAKFGENLVVCILRRSQNLTSEKMEYIEKLLKELELCGKKGIASKLREEMLYKYTHPHETIKWWQYWKS